MVEAIDKKATHSKRETIIRDIMVSPVIADLPQNAESVIFNFYPYFNGNFVAKEIGVRGETTILPHLLTMGIYQWI